MSATVRVIAYIDKGEGMYQEATGSKYRTTLPHDTGFLEVQTPRFASDHPTLTLALTAGSAREYIRKCAEVEGQIAPNYRIPSALLTVTLLAFVTTLALSTFGGEAFHPYLLELWPDGPARGVRVVEAVSAVGAIITEKVADRVRAKQTQGVKTVAAEAGTPVTITLDLQVDGPTKTGLEVSSENKIAANTRDIARNLHALTPGLRDRLMCSVAEGDSEGTTTAVQGLLKQSPLRLTGS